MALQENYISLRIHKIKNDYRGKVGAYEVIGMMPYDDLLTEEDRHFSMGIYDSVTEAIQSIFWNFNNKRNQIPWRIEQMPEIDELGDNFKAADLFTQIDDDIIDFEMDPELEKKLNPKPAYKDNVVKLKPKEDKK